MEQEISILKRNVSSKSIKPLIWFYLCVCSDERYIIIYHPSCDIAYGRPRTPAPTIAVTLWKVEYHHFAFLDAVMGNHFSSFSCSLGGLVWPALFPLLQFSWTKIYIMLKISVTWWIIQWHDMTWHQPKLISLIWFQWYKWNKIIEWWVYTIPLL